jgi:hypothetical protein
MTWVRDPVSELFDRGATRLLERAYARPGAWAGTRVKPPAPEQVAFALYRGINVFRPDPQAGDRWTRAFLRSLYHLNTWYFWGGQLQAGHRRMSKNPQAIRYQVGTRNPQGWPVRVMVVPGGGRGYAQVPGRDSYVRDAAVRSDPMARDWGPA